MSTITISARVLQLATNPAVPYAPLPATPQAFAGGDRVAIVAERGNSLGTVLLRISNTDGAPHAVTAAAADPVVGYSKPRPSTWQVPAGSAVFVGPLDSSLVTQADGTVLLTIEAGHAGTIEALQMPRGA